MVAILMMSAKLATLGFLKIKAFWNKGYDVIIFVHDVQPNYMVDVVIWPKFCNSSIYMKEVIINSVL